MNRLYSYIPRIGYRSDKFSSVNSNAPSFNNATEIIGLSLFSLFIL